MTPKDYGNDNHRGKLFRKLREVHCHAVASSHLAEEDEPIYDPNSSGYGSIGDSRSVENNRLTGLGDEEEGAPLLDNVRLHSAVHGFLVCLHLYRVLNL